MSCELLAQVWRRKLPPREKLVLLAMADGEEVPAAIALKCSLDLLELIDALHALAAQLLVIRAHGRWYFRVGDVFRDQQGSLLR